MAWLENPSAPIFPNIISLSRSFILLLKKKAPAIFRQRPFLMLRRLKWRVVSRRFRFLAAVPCSVISQDWLKYQIYRTERKTISRTGKNKSEIAARRIRHAPIFLCETLISNLSSHKVLYFLLI